MTRKLSDTMQFDPKASKPMRAIVMIYDISGFSKFFNQPDVQEYVPLFLNHISSAFSTVFNGGLMYWSSPDKPVARLGIDAVHEKFMGDGCMYIGLPLNGALDFPPSDIGYLCNRLWNIQNNFHKIRKKTSEFIPVFDLPDAVRIGLAKGTVYELVNARSRQREYLGVCINLASRLHKYCSGLSFVASARIELPENLISQHGYKKVVAKKINGFPKEIVIVDKKEYEALTSELRGDLFEEIQLAGGKIKHQISTEI